MNRSRFCNRIRRHRILRHCIRRCCVKTSNTMPRNRAVVWIPYKELSDIIKYADTLVSERHTQWIFIHTILMIGSSFTTGSIIFFILCSIGIIFSGLWILSVNRIHRRLDKLNQIMIKYYSNRIHGHYLTVLSQNKSQSGSQGKLLSSTNIHAYYVPILFSVIWSVLLIHAFANGG